MPRRTESRRFISIDGEAIDGKYAFLAWSNGTKRVGLWADNGKELSTAQCLNFLMECGRANPKVTLVMFGQNYDVNMILRDLPRESLEKLWAEGQCAISVNGALLSLAWIPRKMFTIYSIHDKQRVRIYDVFGFFQSSFVRALEDWKIADPHGEIKRMKTERARFTWEQRKEIEKYCFSECDLLIELMNKLETSMQSAGIKLRSYMGAGSVAAALLYKEKVKAHHVSDSTYERDIQRAIHCAYFGGRVEVCIQGILRNVTNYDIISAYPHQSLSLPSLHNGRWRAARLTEIDNRNHYALWNVEWDIPHALYVMPFPLRRGSSIYYPSNGRGWYHHDEVRAAMELCDAAYFKIRGGFIFEPETDDKPFAFVREYYQMRREAKERGDAAEKAYKLGLNSLYGKLAQGLSYRGEPPFRSLYWAGRITAGTRARLLDCASLDPHGVVSMATDGIVFASDPGIETSTNLGGFERTQIDELFIAQPGIYRMRTHDGKEVCKSRGFFTREIDYDDLQEGWLYEGTGYSQKAVCECGHKHTTLANGNEVSRCKRCECVNFSRRRRFIGLGTALARKDFSVWRTWVESDRILSLYSSRKFYETTVPGRVTRLFPPRFPAIVESEPYVPKTRTIEDREELLELLQGSEQPLTIGE